MRDHLPKNSEQEQQNQSLESDSVSSESATPQKGRAAASTPNLTPARILALQRTMGNRYVTGLIQRTLSSRAKRAYETAIAQNSGAYEEPKKWTDELMPEKEQDAVSQVRGTMSRMKKSPEQEKKLKDFIRAYLLSEYARRLKELPTKYPDLDEKGRDKKKKQYFSKSKEKRDMYSALVGKGVAAPETRAFLDWQGFSGGLPASSDEVKDKAEGPKIDVRSTFIAGTVLGKRVRAHLFIVYTAEDGKQLYFRGGPSGSGDVEVDWGDYTPDTVDYDPSAPSETVLKGPDATSKIDGLIEAAKAINGMGVKYSGGGVFQRGENCNSAAWTMLTRAGIPAKHPGSGFPGWGYPVGSLSEKDMPKEEEIPENGQPYVVVAPTENEYSVWVDREKHEVATKLAGRTEIEFLDMVGNLARVRYQGSKIGYMNLFEIEPTKDAVDLLKGRVFLIASSTQPFKVGSEAQDIVPYWLDTGDSVEVVDKDFDPDTADEFDLVRIRFTADDSLMLGEVNAMMLVPFG